MLKIHLAGGYVMAHQHLKAGTKDIDVIVETKDQVGALDRALEAAAYHLLPNGTLAAEYQALGATTYENSEGFRWEIFRKTVANKLSLTRGMKSRAKSIRRGGKLQVSNLSNEDIFLMKGVTERDRDLEDMSRLARTGLDYRTILEECTIQSERTGRIWETGLYVKCLELQDKYEVTVPIARKLRKIGEEKMLSRQILKQLGIRNMSEEDLASALKGKLNSKDIAAGIKILVRDGKVRKSKTGRIKALK